MADDNDKHNPDHVEIDLDAARRGGPRLDEGAQTIMGGGAQTLMLTSDMLTSTQPGDEERRQAAPLLSIFARPLFLLSPTLCAAASSLTYSLHRLHQTKE